MAADTTEVLATLKAYSDGFNTGDPGAGAALCAGQAVIIDEFPPHVWQGATACADWAAGLAAFSDAGGYTEAHITAGKPKALTVTGDHAYAVLPATLTYKKHEKPLTQSGLWTFSLQKLDAGWRITGWAWALE
ncbi:MAG TPA: nuclear transport factor 2 family protein [Alphaproteobacteria bacterium]|nr:nuclear transport factor 2 family protein [Alphaproteobacteria bacterium]